MAELPAELSELVGARRWGALLRTPPIPHGDYVAWRPNVLPPAGALALVDVLEREMTPHLKRVEATVPDPDGYTERNYQEQLPKVLRNRTAILNSPRAAAAKAAAAAGLLTLMRSASLRALAEHLSGERLGDEVGCQVICYEPGDYVGPHHDAHPEDWNLRDGYVDFHLSMSSDGVDHHWLVCQDGEHLSRMFDVAKASGVIVSRLPFWHYTTPLAARPGREAEARRWLLLVSFDKDQSGERR